MSLRAIPLMVVPLVLYNVLVLFAGSGGPGEIMGRTLIDIPLAGRVWSFTMADLIILVTMLLLFIELLKSTYTSTASLLDHGLSMIVFIVCLIQFILVPMAAHSAFFFIMIATLIDVIAGYTIGIRVARRDLSIGANE